MCFLQQRATADAEGRVQQGKRMKTIPSTYSGLRGFPSQRWHAFYLPVKNGPFFPDFP